MRTHSITVELTGKEVEQLREVIDALPLRPFAPLVYKVLLALPLFPESIPPVERLPELEKLLARLPHGGVL